MVSFKGSHLLLNAEIASTVFGAASHALVHYVKDQNHLLVTPNPNVWFTKMYKAAPYLIKERNIKGDKTIALTDMIIDHNLNPNNDNLSFDWIAKTKLLKIKL